MTVRKTLQDSAYIAVGVAVLGAQRAQVRRREVATQLHAFRSQATNRIVPMIDQVAEPVQAAIEPAITKISQLPETAMEMGSYLSELPNQMTVLVERLSDAQVRMNDALQRALVIGKARLGGTTSTTASPTTTTDAAAAHATRVAQPFTSTNNATSTIDNQSN